MSIKIRPARSADQSSIIDFNRRLAAETESKSLDSVVLTRGVEALLKHPDRGRYFIAERDGAIAGQLLITYEWSDWRDGTFWWLQSVYVAAEHRRRGVFAALYTHVATLAREDGTVCGLRLYVDASNRDAASTYRALGFTLTHYELMELELR
jgi:ribosomal protein S18 acetylase RimI-like enzyme